MKNTPIPTTLPPDLMDELLALMAGSGDDPSDELLDKLSDASGNSKRDLMDALQEKRAAISASDAETYGAMGVVTKG